MEGEVYKFEAQSRRLKQYYDSNREELVGRRVLFGNRVASVRYVGSVEGKPSQEVWAGVEWDEKGAGKHDGTVQGKEYFKCPAAQGSLVRFDKIEFGYNFQTALFKRYFRNEELSHAHGLYEQLQHLKQQPPSTNKEDHQQAKQEEKKEQQLVGGKEETIDKMKNEAKKYHKIEYDAEAYIQTIKKSKRIMIEFVGFDEVWSKINNLQKLQSISLAECRICDLGAKGYLSALLPNLRVLSLENNLISHWDQVVQLGYQLPHLMELSLAHNRIASPPQDYHTATHYCLIGRGESLELHSPPFLNLKCLILINTHLTWHTLMWLLPLFPALEELLLCRNDLSQTNQMQRQRIQTYLKEIRFLNLEQCCISEFVGLQPFGALPLLQRIILNKNPLEAIRGQMNGFESVRHLSVQQCEIREGVVLSQLAALLPDLVGLNVKHNPVGDRLSYTYVRQRAVAEFPRLTTINGATLKKYERKDCQIFYMRQSFKEYFVLKNVPDYDYDFQDFMAYCEKMHPNMGKLIKRYGNPFEVERKSEIKEKVKEEVREVEAKKGTGMVEVKVQIAETGVVMLKRIPLSWTLSSLKNFFSKAAKVPLHLIKLICYSEGEGSAELMTEDHKTLSYYNLSNASKIVIHRE